MPASTATSPDTARGILEQIVGPTATAPGYLVLFIPGTSYRLHLRPSGEPSVAIGRRLHGIIRCDVRRADRISGGGRYVEPVVGRPRRVQGTVINTSDQANTITVDVGGGAVPGFESGLPIVCRLTDPRQKAADFTLGQMICCDVHEGATITLA